ncbi:hypothetical protein C9374_007898 [Naegleria lovaniensis]|uniref:SAP domain-containing protein n=1 Tax=Naegleria lovaniensis TaxID=51637 RepID=A0AA88GKF4_NAELO|nr:uncharacterized protein C9374_007898 [Naegleria lovaniensis]KAG2378750.1 hypothetical protein C9374_007898 [Naegleria lovaniensis]
MSTSPMLKSGDQWSATSSTNNLPKTEGTTTDQTNVVGEENLPSSSTTSATEPIRAEEGVEGRDQTSTVPSTTPETTTTSSSRLQEPSAMTFEDVTSTTSTGEPSEEHPPIITEEGTSPMAPTSTTEEAGVVSGGGMKQPTTTTTMGSAEPTSAAPPHLASTTASVTVVSGDENTDDPLRANYLNKSFYHLNSVDDETISSYCKYFGENVEGITSKYRKLARLISHYPNFVRRGMERFTLDNLKEMCQELNLSTEGKKSILIDHLFDYYMNIHKGDSLEMMVTNEVASKAETSTSPQLRKSTRTHKKSPKLGEEEHEEEEEEAAGPTRAPRKARTQRKTKKTHDEEEEEEEGAVAEEEEETTTTQGPSGSKKRKMSHDTSSSTQETSITKSEFLRLAKELRFTVDDKEHVAHQKGELHGSFGWHYSGKSNIVLDRYNVPVTITLNVVVNKSGRKKEE